MWCNQEFRCLNKLGNLLVIGDLKIICIIAIGQN